MLRAMSKIFGIIKLMSDPYFSGGGLNVSLKGGLLDVHVDGHYHDASGLNRRINAILYLNPGWKESWGGDFGLYDSTGDNLVKKSILYTTDLLYSTLTTTAITGYPIP